MEKKIRIGIAIKNPLKNKNFEKTNILDAGHGLPDGGATSKEGNI